MQLTVWICPKCLATDLAVERLQCVDCGTAMQHVGVRRASIARAPARILQMRDHSSDRPAFADAVCY